MNYKREELYKLWTKRCSEHGPHWSAPEYGWQAYSENTYETWYHILVKEGYIK